MGPYKQIISIYPELLENKEVFIDGTIVLQDDGNGSYVRTWNYEKPLPINIRTRNS